MLTYSHHWIVIHLLSSSIQAAVVKLGRLVHPWRLCAQSDPICKKNLYQYKFTDTLEAKISEAEHTVTLSGLSLV